MVDTGADSTSIAMRDWQHGPLRFADFGPAVQTITGYGGVLAVPVEPALLSIEHRDGTVNQISLDVEIAPPGGGAVPSILGRDVLERYRLTFSPRERILTLETVR